MNSKGFTLIELLIVCAIGGIGLAVLFGAVTGNNFGVETKQSCLANNGIWKSGMEFGRWTQTCEYGSK
jgi:prepilin-type N-terminal cleavage/methylation domain-containing protein